MFNIPQGPFCQSCGIPMDKTDAGTNSDGSQSELYCAFCFKNGEYTEPDKTLEQAKEFAINTLTQKMGMPEFQAKMIASSFIPKLKRWQ